MNAWRIYGALALAGTLASSALTQLTAQTQTSTDAAASNLAAPVWIRDYQTAAGEAKRSGKPLFVIFRCER